MQRYSSRLRRQFLKNLQEDLADLELTEDWFAGPSLWGTDWTTETIVNQLRRGNINLNPRFQRRNAWDALRKSLFVESLILGLPVPQIILAEEKGKKGSFVVIDGKQRLLTLRQFSARPEGDDFEQLRLTGLSDHPDLLFIATSNFPQAVDSAFTSRCDLVMHVPLPNRDACSRILKDCLSGLSRTYPAIGKLVTSSQFDRCAAECVGLDGRAIRSPKTAMNPEQVTIEDLFAAVQAAKSVRVQGDKHK